MDDDILILASDSPRRAELLQKAAIPFKTISHIFDEDSVSEKNHKKLAMRIAFGKANSIASLNGYKKSFILGVDTIVSYQGSVIGKPSDKEKAREILLRLSGKKHIVISGISLINKSKNIELTKFCLSKVYFDDLPQKLISKYIENDLWHGLAGGYAIQGIFSLMIRKIIGSYSNIVGLPMNMLYSFLKESNFNTLFL